MAKMRRAQCILFNLLLVVGSVTLLSSCAGLSQQYKASTEGISINYTVKKEQFISPKEKVVISSRDERLDKDVIGDGAKSSAGTRVLGYVAFGVIYAVVPDQPTLKKQQDPIQIFKTATAERLSYNGIAVTDDNDGTALAVDLLVRKFKLDFNLGTWTGEVGYVARIQKSGEVVCQKVIYEKVTAFNLYGFGSGERAITEAFNNAINKLDINGCFSKMLK